MHYLPPDETTAAIRRNLRKNLLKRMRQRVPKTKSNRTQPKQNQNQMNIRHPALPKLALCGQYEGTSGAVSEAAARGTKLDEAFRYAWTHSEFPDWELSEEDAQAVRWTINECLKLNGIRDGMVTTEMHCRNKTSLMEHVGTSDGVAVKGRWHMDLKSGQIYDYRPQMAAYALGFMEEHFEVEWTAHLLFCDQKRVVTHHFTYDSAKEIVSGVLRNIGTAPKENEYCGWCSKSLTCPARVASKDQALAIAGTYNPTVQDVGFLALLNDPERLGKFLAACSTLEDFRDAAKAKARELLEAGQQVPGWKLQKPRASAYVDGEVIAQAVEKGLIGAGDAIRALGNLSGKKAEALWSNAGQVLPDETVQQKIGQAPLVASK
jgi:hypothetical protein